MMLLNSILNYNVIEFWSNSDNHLKCIQFYVSSGLESYCPNLGTFGLVANPTWREKSLSLIAAAQTTENNLVWRKPEGGDDNVSPTASADINDTDPSSNEPNVFTVESISLPIKTEMAVKVVDDASGMTFLVGYSINSVEYTPEKGKFALSIATALYHMTSIKFRDELDVKLQVPRKFSTGAIAMSSYLSSTRLTATPDRSDIKRIEEVPELDLSALGDGGYCFPVDLLGSMDFGKEDIYFEVFRSLKQVSSGTHSVIYKGLFRGKDVVIKMISEKAQDNPIAVAEFEMEHNILARIKHSNIIRYLGSGREPRHFLVLEYLGGGMLHDILHKNDASLTYRLFRRHRVPNTKLMRVAKNLAAAIHYLHYEVHPNATIIHRDIKPENIAISADGEVKLIDFGLATCVKRNSEPNDVYEMTGMTGSLRYMAPEVALGEPYCEKADVYSFAIVLWQLASDKIPFENMKKNDFMTLVVQENERPRIDKSWNTQFSDLLRACWDRDQNKRPTSTEVLRVLSEMLEAREKEKKHHH